MFSIKLQREFSVISYLPFLQIFATFVKGLVSQPTTYAKDTSITFASSDVEEMNRINLDLNGIKTYLKCKTELLSNLTANPTIKISQFLIKKRSLDYKIFRRANWECCVNVLSERIASCISGIHRISIDHL